MVETVKLFHLFGESEASICRFTSPHRMVKPKCLLKIVQSVGQLLNLLKSYPVNAKLNSNPRGGRSGLAPRSLVLIKKSYALNHYMVIIKILYEIILRRSQQITSAVETTDRSKMTAARPDFAENLPSETQIEADIC